MYIPASDFHEIITAAEGLEPAEGEVVLIMLAEEKIPDINDLVAALDENGIDFIGGIFPRIIHGENIYSSGAVISLLPVAGKTLLVKDIGADTIDILDQLSEMSIPKKSTALILVDGLSASIHHFLSQLFQKLGTSVKYLGGGAGYIDFQQRPCIFCRQGIYQDAALITFITADSELGIRHGWTRIAGPFVATKSEGNIVKELNWIKAYDVYKEVVEQESGLHFDETTFFDIAKGYPFGIYSEGQEDIVRDPVQVNDEKELVCVGEVPENAVLNILKGEKNTLVNSAEQAIKDCLGPGLNKIESCLVMDCISRVLFLEDDFKEELMAIKKEIESNNSPVIAEGALTFGEIASREQGILEFYNKTIVIGAFHE